MFKLITFKRKPALLAEAIRIPADQRIKGLYYYEIRHSDDLFTPCTGEPYVLVNFWGTLVTHESFGERFNLQGQTRATFMWRGRELEGNDAELHLKQFRMGFYDCKPDELLPSISEDELRALMAGDVVSFRMVNRGTNTGTIDFVERSEEGTRIAFRNHGGYLNSCTIAGILSHQRLVDVKESSKVIITVEGGVADVYHHPPHIEVQIVDFDNGDELDD